MTEKKVFKLTKNACEKAQYVGRDREQCVYWDSGDQGLWTEGHKRRNPAIVIGALGRSWYNQVELGSNK